MPIIDLCNTTEISNIVHKEQESIFITKTEFRFRKLNFLEVSKEEYQKCEKYLKIIGGDGLSEEDLDAMDNMIMATIVDGISTTLVELFPNVKVGDKVEIPAQ